MQHQLVHRGSSQIGELAGDASLAGQTLPRVLLGGPQTLPCTSYNPGPVHIFMVMLFPQALHALTGIDMSRHVNRFVALDAVLNGPWQALAQQVLAAHDDDARVALVEQFLEPQWRAARAAGAAPGNALGDWVNGLAGHVAAAGWGRSARNLERRIKAWSGQPLRRLRRMSRAEQSFLESRTAREAGTVSWAEMAARRLRRPGAPVPRDSRDHRSYADRAGAAGDGRRKLLAVPDLGLALRPNRPPAQ